MSEKGIVTRARDAAGVAIAVQKAKAALRERGIVLGCESEEILWVLSETVFAAGAIDGARMCPSRGPRGEEPTRVEGLTIWQWRDKHDALLSECGKTTKLAKVTL